MTDTLSMPWRWLIAIAGCLLPLALPAADPAALEQCRALRHDNPQVALDHCEDAAALSADGAHDDAFEAWMHSADLASQLGQFDRAGRALDQAATLLPSIDDPLAVHRIARRRGLNAYRAGDNQAALSRFLEALAVARSANDAAARAISENDLGVSYRHAGNFTAALEHFQSSLELRQALGHADLGALMANIGSLYLALGDPDRAELYLSQALEDHRSDQRTLQQSKTREELAKVALHRGDRAAAEQHLDAAWNHYRSVQAQGDQLRLALFRAGLHADHAESVAASHWLTLASDLADSHESSRDVPLQIALIDAGLAQAGTREAAYRALVEAADRPDTAPELLIRAQASLADLAEALGQPQQAIRHLRRFHTLADAASEARHDQHLQSLRVRFDVARLQAEHDQLAARNARADAELARRRTQMVVVAASALVALILLASVLGTRLQRQRLRQDRERQTLQQRIVESRQAAESLRSDIRSLTRLLEQQDGATVLFDAGGRIRAATNAAAAWFGREPADLVSRTLAEVLPESVALWAQALVESASLSDDAHDNELLGERNLHDQADSPRLQCRRLTLEEEVGVLQIVPTATDLEGKAAASSPPAATADPADVGDDPVDFRTLLVQLMTTSLETWERITRKGRIDLAQASGIWRITIDDGRLRVRAMDRYLRLDTLPERPRWREVLRTAYFILAELPLTAAQRSQIETQVDALLAQTRALG